MTGSNFPIMVREPLVGQGLLLVEASRSHSLMYTTLGRTTLGEWWARRRKIKVSHSIIKVRLRHKTRYS